MQECLERFFIQSPVIYYISILTSYDETYFSQSYMYIYNILSNISSPQESETSISCIYIPILLFTLSLFVRNDRVHKRQKISSNWEIYFFPVKGETFCCRYNCRIPCEQHGTILGLILLINDSEMWYFLNEKFSCFSCVICKYIFLM